MFPTVPNKSEQVQVEPIPENKDFASDNLEQVEYMNKLLAELQKVNWRRINHEFTIESQRHQVYVHDRCINKIPRMLGSHSPSNVAPPGFEPVLSVVKVLVLDHLNVVKESVV